MHYMQTQSNLRFIAITSLSAAPSSIRTLLHRIYADAYVEYVTRNPLVASAEAGGARLLRGNEMFRRKVDELVRGVAVVAG